MNEIYINHKINKYSRNYVNLFYTLYFQASLYSNNERKKEEKEFFSRRSSQDLAFIKNKQKCDTKSEVKHRLGHIPS